MEKLYSREEVKKALLKSYSNSGADLILRGIRKPSYAVIVDLHKKHNISFDIWLDIKSHIKNDTKKDKKSSSGSASVFTPKDM